MKYHTCTRLLSLVLAVVMMLSLLSVAAFAAGAPDYAHLEIGTANGAPGDTVKIPVYLKGLKEGQKCRGFDTTVVLGENLTPVGAEWTDLVSGFGYKIFNKDSGYLTATDIMNGGFRITADGKLCDLLVKIADDATSVGAVSLTKVSISGNTAVDFLNSTDGTMTTRDLNAVVKPTDENGNELPVISVKQAATFTMKVEADKASVTAGKDVTITVKVEGGDFVGAAAKLAYDSSKFTIKAADTGTGWSKTSNGYAYYNVAADQSATLGTFVFTALAQAEEVTGSFTLSDTYCEETWDSGASTAVATPCANNGKVDVTITLKTDLDVTAENKTVTYDGNAHAFNEVTTTAAAGATIAYGETEGTYDLTDVPSKTDANTYTLYYKVTAPGYAPKTGRYTLTINPAEIKYTAEGYNMPYDGDPHTISVTVTEPTDADITYSETEDGTYTATAPTLTDVGSKTVWFKIMADNYTEVTASKTITITEAEITFEISANAAVTYNGDSHVSASVTSKLPEDATVAYTCKGQSYTDIPSFTDAGTYEVSYTVTRANYTEKTGSYTFIINKADIDSSKYSITAKPDVNYDGAAHVSATAIIPDGMTVTYTYDGRTYNTVPSFTDVGNYTVSYTITAGGNYNDVTGSYTFKIKEGTLTGINATGYTGEYDGQAHTITVTAPEGAAVTYSKTENGEYIATAPTLTDAGTKTVYWKVEKPGYTTVPGSNTITITKKAVTITIDAKSKSIGDVDPEFTATVTGLVDENDLGTITYTREPGETAGTYEIRANYTENANYDVTVTKANLTISAPTFVVETVEDYVTGYSLVLVYTDGNATFTYNGTAMYDVTTAGYKCKTEESASYAHVYALVVKDKADQTKIAAGTTPVAGTLQCNDLDVNKSNSVDLRDAVAVVAVYNANETYMTKYMSIVLEADVNHDKKVDSKDFGEIKAEYLK